MQLAEAMMQIYPDDSGIEYKIVDNRSFAEGNEIIFDFVTIEVESIASLTVDAGDSISPNGAYHAFTACDLELCQQRLFIENMESSQIFEVLFSMRLPWRPLDRLVWLDESILAFSQPSNPHYGFRFAIDISQKEHLLTLVLADECYITGNCSG